MTNDEQDALMPYVQLAREGDADALREVLTRLDPLLRKFVSTRFPGFLRRRVDESDVAQVARIRIHATICDFEGLSGRHFCAWACLKVRAAIKDEMQKHGREKRSRHLEVDAADAPAFVIADDTSPSQNMQRAEELERLITRLHDPMRIVMHLLYSDGMTPETAAEALSWSVEDVEIKRVQGLRQLKKLKRNAFELGTAECRT